MSDTSCEDKLLLTYKLLPLSVMLKKTLSLFSFLNAHWSAILWLPYRNINHCHVTEKPKEVHVSGKNEISYASSDEVVTSQKYCTVQHMHILLYLGNPRKKCNTLCGYVPSECPNHTFLTVFQASLNFCALTLSTCAQNNSILSCSCSLGTLPRTLHELFSPLPSAVFLMLEKL